MFVVKVLKQYLLSVAVVISTATTISAYAQDEIKQLIDRINQQAKHVSFTGQVLHQQGDVEQLLQVARVCELNGHDERIVALDGSASEIVRMRDKVWYFHPQNGAAMESYVANEHTGLTGLALSKKLQQNYAKLQTYYQFVHGETATIANRSASQLKIISKDKWRFGYHLWIDDDSGLILRTDIYDASWQALESYIFQSVDLDKALAKKGVLPSAELVEMQKEAMNEETMEMPLAQSNWQFTDLPPGYKVQQRLLIKAGSDAQSTEQYIIGDGLGAFSVMVQTSDTATSKNSTMQWGAMNVFSLTNDGYKFTALGEAPIETLEKVVTAVRAK